MVALTGQTGKEQLLLNHFSGNNRRKNTPAMLVFLTQ